MLFFNINFLRFRPRFWSLLGLQDGAKLAQNRKNHNPHPPWCHLTLSVFQQLQFGGCQARFWRPQASILEAPGLDFGGPGPRFWEAPGLEFGIPGLDFRASRPTCSGKTLFPQVSCLKRLPPSFSSFPNCMAVLQHSHLSVAWA